MLETKSKEVLLLLPEPPQALRESGISIRYIPLIESLHGSCTIDAMIISKESFPEESFSLLRKYCRNVFYITHPKSNEVSSFNKLLTRLSFFLPWSFPRSWITYGSKIIKKRISELTTGIRYQTVICVSGYNYPFISAIKTNKIVIDFIDSPSILSWRNVIGSNRSYPVRLFECLKTFIWEARIIRNTDASLYISSFDVNTVPNFIAPSNKRHVIRNGYSADDYTTGIISTIKHPAIGFLGNMSYFPNIEAVTWLHDNVFTELKKSIPELSFYIIGRSPSAEISKLANSPGVVITGGVDSIWEYLNSIDIMVFPLLRGAGVKNKILEAMYANRLVLTTKIGDEGIDAAQEDALVLCNTSNQYIGSIKKYIASEDERKQISAKGRDFVINNFSWQSIQRKFRQVVLD